MRTTRYTVPAAAALLLATSAPTAHAADRTERVSVSSSGRQADGASRAPSISGQGRYVAFDSTATDLVSPPFPAPVQQVYRRDRRAGTTVLVSASSAGVPADFGAFSPEMSRDGRFVAFDSNASDLVPGVSAPGTQVYLRDITAGTTALVSASPDGKPADTTAVASAISADGRYVVFVSDAANLVPGAGGARRNVFVRDVVAAATTVADLAPDGKPGAGNASDAAISANGRWVAFASDASNLVPGDTNGFTDVFLRDRRAGTTVLVSVARGGGPGNAPSNQAAVSDDGSVVAFTSFATNLVADDTGLVTRVFARDVRAGRTERISVPSRGGRASGPSFSPSISADGRRVAFLSRASDLVPGDTNGRTDVFVRDRAAGTTVRASLAASGAQARNNSATPVISADGRVAAFASAAGNLVRHDTNNDWDVFVRELFAASP